MSLRVSSLDISFTFSTELSTHGDARTMKLLAERTTLYASVRNIKCLHFSYSLDKYTQLSVLKVDPRNVRGTVLWTLNTSSIRINGTAKVSLSKKMKVNSSFS